MIILFFILNIPPQFGTGPIPNIPTKNKNNISISGKLNNITATTKVRRQDNLFFFRKKQYIKSTIPLIRQITGRYTPITKYPMVLILSSKKTMDNISVIPPNIFMIFLRSSIRCSFINSKVSSNVSVTCHYDFVLCCL